ncbi:hypothetical protein V502_00571, partial [Pseudogymnoascus sp. VKM F-4520 (FW-2644)]
MATDTRTLLHVVYAGRGDALILEYTTVADRRRHFVLVDGGPMTTGPKDYKATPYYKYLFHAIKDVWSKRDPSDIIDVDAMICSHPHADHIEGLIHLLNSMDVEASLLMFNGPFVYPNVSASELRKLNKVFKKVPFVKVDGGWTATTAPGISVDYPRDNVLVYERGKRLPGIIDRNPVNLESILMSTDPAATAGAGRVYFTGDNVGHIIEKYVGPRPAGTPLKKFSIYKIQHHGSKNNSEINVSSKGVGVMVEREGAVLCILTHYVASLTGVLSSAPLPVEIPEDSLLYLGEYMKTQLGTLAYVRRYLGELVGRQAVYKTSILAKTVLASLSPKDGGNFPAWMKTTPNVLMKNATYYFNHLNDNDTAFQCFYDITGTHYKWQTWWDKWQKFKSFSSEFYSLFAIPGIKDFYSSFQADIYVISANQRFLHPSEATLIGLGLAVQAQGRAAQVYLTEGQTVNSSNIVDLCATATGGAVTADQLFDPSRLSIWYRNSGYYFTLDGNGTPPADGNREITGRAAQLSFATDMVTRERLKNQLEADTTVLPLRTTISNTSEVIYNVYCPVGATNWYLNLLSGQPQVSSTINATTYLYDSTDQWPGLSPGAKTSTYIYIVQTTTGPPAATFPRIFQVGSRSGRVQDKNLAWELIWERPVAGGSRSEKATFYVNNTTNAVVSGTYQDPPPTSGTYQDPPPTGYDALRFHFNIVSAGGVSPKLSMRPHGAALPTLKDYYTAIGLLMPSTISCEDALRALLGTSIVGQLDLSLNFEVVVLGWPVDPDKSTVDFDDEKISTTVHAVSLSFALPPGTTIPFDNVNLKVLLVTLTMDWPDDTTNPETPLKLDLVVVAERSVTLSCNPSLNNVDRMTTVRKCLLGMGVTTDALNTLCVPKLLSFLINKPNTIVEAFLNTIPSFLVNSGLPLLKPDLDNSTVDAFWDPIGKIIIRRADVICKVAGVSGWALQSIAGIAVTMGDITITATDILTPNQQLSFTGSASFTNVAETEGIALGFSCVLGTDAGDLIFSISGSDAISALPTLLPGVQDLTQLKTPFSASTLGQMKSSMIGFSINQPVNSIPTYDLASVFVVVNFDDWKAFLPSSFPIGGIDDDNVIIRVLVMEPRNTDTMLVAVNIDCSVQLSSPLPPVLNVNFAADPLVTAGSYEFRLTVGAPPIRDLGATTGLTLVNVCQAIGMADISSGIRNYIPVLGQVLNAIQVVEVSVAILQQTTASTTTYTFGDWSLSLYVDSFIIVPKVLTITLASMDMQNINGLFSCEVNGSIVLSSANATTEVDVVFNPPTQGATGQIRIDAPRGLSIANIMDAFGLPDLTSVPVLDTIISLAVNSVHCTLGYPENSTDIACLGAAIELSLDILDIGIFSLAALTLSIEYHEPNDPLGPGYEQKAFSIRSLLADGTLAATVSYDSYAGTLSATLVQVQTVSLTQLLEKILPSMAANALSGLIGNMNFDHVDLVLDTTNKNIKSFSIALTSDETLAVGNLTLTSLSVVYAAATTGPPATTATLVVQGAVGKDTVGAVISITCTSNDAALPAVNSTVNVSFSVTPLTPTSLPLTGFIGLLGIPVPTYTPPAGCPTFDGLQVTDISGEISVAIASTSSTATSASLEIVSLDASVITLPGSGIGILPILGIQLTQMRLNISYANKLTCGSISGYLPINKIGGIWVLFAIQRGQELYAADLNLDSQQQMDATEIYHTFLNADEWTIPTDLSMPSALPLVDLHARVIRGVSIDIWGFGTTGSAGWEVAASGVELTTASLGGRIRILEPQKPTTSLNDYLTSAVPEPTPTQRQYDVYIIGTASFTGFTGANTAEARLNIKPNDGVTFTAGVTKTAAGSDLNTLSQELDASPGSNWSSIIPQSTSSISLDQDGIYVYANLTKGKTAFALYGSVTGIGYLLLLGRPNLTPGSTGRSYFVSLVIQDLGAIWPSFSNIMGLFDFGMLTVDIMTYDGTLNDIYTDLKNLPIDFAASDVVVPDASTVITPMLAEYGQTKLDNGAFFSGTLSLAGKSPKPMTGGFVMASDPSSTGTVTFWAQVPENPSTAVFGMIMTDVALLGGAIVINGFGKYTKKLLKISAASLVLTIPDMADPLDFQVELSVTPEETNFSVSTSKLTLPSPFGNMFSVTFEALGIAGNIVQVQGKAVPTYTLSTTSVLLGGNPTGLGGSIILPEGKPQIAVLDAMNMNILDIFTKIIQYNPGSGSTAGSWPALYNPFTVKNAVIYYNRGAAYTSKGITYRPNYNVYAELSIFGVEFSLDINIPSRAGIKVVGTYIGTIGLKFVQLGPYPPSAPTTVGPTLSIDTTANTTVYQYESAVSFFGLQGLDITLQYTKDGDDDVYSGDLKYDGTILSVPNPSISVSYNSMTDQWSFGPWNIIKDLGNAIDIIQEIIKQSETQPCHSLVGLALDNVTVKVSPKLTLTSGTDASRIALVGTPYLMVSFDVTFSLSVAKTEICSLSLPNDQLIPPQKMEMSVFDTSSLESFVLSVFIQFAKNLSLAVLGNPSALGALIAQMAILEFSEDLVTNLICRGCNNADLETAAKNWANKNHSDARRSGGQSEDKFNETMTAAVLSTAVALFAAGATLLSTTQGILGQLTSLIGKLAKVFGVDSALEQALAEIQNEANKIMVDQLAANDFLNKALDMGGAPGLTWASATRLEDEGPQTSVTIDWSKALPNSNDSSWYEDFNGFQWIVSANTTGGIRDPGTVTYTETDSTKRKTTLRDDDFAYSSTIYVWVTAQYGDFHTDGTPPAATVTHIPYLRPPTLTLASTATGLTLQFSGQASPPAQETYVLQIAGTYVASRSLILFQQTLPNPPLEGITISWDQFTPTSTMPTSISAYTQAVSSDPSKAYDSLFAASTTSFNLLALPTGLAVTPDDNDTNIIMSWNQPGAMPAVPDYDLEVRDQNNVLIKPITITPESSPDGKRSAQISSTKFTQGESIAVAVRAHIPSTAPQGTISIFTLPVTSVIQPYAIPVVDYGNTYWDILSQTLHLAVGFAFDIPSSSTFQVRQADLTLPSLTISSSTITKSSASLVVTGVPSNPWPKAILVAASLYAGEIGPYSEPWTFPAAAAGGIAAPFPLVEYSYWMHMTVNWCLVPNAQWTMLTLTSEPRPSPPLPITQRIDSPGDGCTFDLEDFSDVGKGKHKKSSASRAVTGPAPEGWTLYLSMESCANGIRGGGTVGRACVVSDVAGWGVSSTPLINTAVVGKNSNLAVTSRVPGQTIEVFFVSGVGRIEASFYDSSLPVASQWTRSTVTPEQGMTPPTTGATITAFSRDTKHLEIMWICPDGSIAGHVYSPSSISPTGQWTPGSYTAFSKPGVARTDNSGGRIATGVISPNAVELFWIAPENTLCAASWTSAAHGWSAASSCDSTKAAAQTPLVAGSVNGKSMHAFFLGDAYGANVTGAYRLAPSSWAAYEVGDGEGVAGGAGMAVRSASGAGFVVNWVKKAGGRVSSAWLPRLETPPPFAVQDVGVAAAGGSVATATVTGLVSVARGSDDVADVFWFGGDGAMLGAETHGDSAGAEAAWTGFKMAGCATRTDGGSQAVVAASLEAENDRARTEDNIQKAIIALQLKEFKSIRLAADHFEVPKSTLADRMSGKKTRAVAHEIEQALSNAEENTLARWITRLTATGFRATPMLIKEMAEEVRARRV